MENKRKAIICDLDGTLALFEKEDKTKPNYRNPYDASTCENDLLNQVVFDIIKYHRVIFVSGREDKYRNQTARWLEIHQIGYDNLFMRKSGDYRKDAEIKKEIYERDIKSNYHIDFVLDDRDQVVKMWRGLGLICLQVAEGNF